MADPMHMMSSPPTYSVSGKNTHGMALFANGGLVGSQAYAAPALIQNRMSEYYTGCIYDPKLKLGPRACAFNYLHWYFLIVNQTRLKSMMP